MTVILGGLFYRCRLLAVAVLLVNNGKRLKKVTRQAIRSSELRLIEKGLPRHFPTRLFVNRVDLP